MSKVGIIYWSSTGNTEAMAQAVEEGATMVRVGSAIFGARHYPTKA